MRRSLLALAILVLVLGPAAVAKDKDKDKGKGKGDKAEHSKHDHGSGVRVAVDIFVGDDQEFIRGYCASRGESGLPPGLAKRGGKLPPGLEKQLRKKGSLPPGLQKKLVAFPDDLEAGLHPLEPGLRRGFIEGRAVIYNEKTSVILDVFLPL